MSQEHSVALHTVTLHNLYNSTQPMMIIFLEVGRYRIPTLLKLPLSLAKSWFCWPSWTITVVGKRRKSLRLSTIGFVKSYWWTWILSLPYFPSSWNYTVLSLFTKIKPSKDISVRQISLLYIRNEYNQRSTNQRFQWGVYSEDEGGPLWNHSQLHSDSWVIMAQSSGSWNVNKVYYLIFLFWLICSIRPKLCHITRVDK